MNDLDLRTALHRDADLVGEPSPHLLEQLGQRRRHQRRQRAGALTAVLGVVVIAAGIPVGQSLLARSSSAPADSPAVVQETPSVAPTTELTAPTTTAPAPPSATTAVPAPTTEVAPPAAPAATVTCPDEATLLAALQAAQPSTPEHWSTMTDPTQSMPFEVVCSGTWAGAGYWDHWYVVDATGALTGDPDRGDRPWIDGQAGLFRHIDGSWTFLPRNTHCDDEGIPPTVWERACNVD